MEAQLDAFPDHHEAPKPVIEQSERGELYHAAIPEGWSLQQISNERFAPWPYRSRGSVHVYDAAGFIAMVRRRRSPELAPIVYADEASNQLVAILNDDDAGEGDPHRGWRDYRVELKLRRTPEWELWLGLDKRLVSQSEFAEHIENGLLELVEPEPAAMLDLAQSFHAHTSAEFKSGQRLNTGEVQFRYEETVDAVAGGSGTLSIPERIKIVVSPFYGSARYEVGAGFRYRLTRDAFKLGYKLDRPHDVERAAFNDIRTAVDAGLEGITVVSGEAPHPTEPAEGRVLSEKPTTRY